VFGLIIKLYSSWWNTAFSPTNHGVCFNKPIGFQANPKKMRQNTAIYFQKGLKPCPNGAGFWIFSRNLTEVQKHHGVC